jgi:hypothetical protein
MGDEQIDKRKGSVQQQTVSHSLLLCVRSNTSGINPQVVLLIHLTSKEPGGFQRKTCQSKYTEEK